MTRFRKEDTPREVIARVRERAGEGWPRVWEEEGTLAVAKLRLAGVYDDRQDGFFMLRIRIPGGRLTWPQAEAIGQVVQQFARKPSPELEGPDRFGEVTTRQDIQVHWVRFDDLPTIWDRLEAVGLNSLQACGDSARNVTGCAVAGIDPEAAFDATPVVEQVNQYALDNPALSAFLPRKFKISITGCRTDCIVARINDLAFTPARRDGQLGFHVWAGGGLSDYPRLASSMDLFVRPEEVVDVATACLRLFGDLGDPLHKAVNRFRALVEELGPARTREELLRRLPAPLPTAGEDLSTGRPGDHLGVHPSTEPGRVFVGLNVPVGRLTGEELVEVARLAREYGDGGIRLSQRQNVILTGVAPERVPALRQEPLLRRLRPDPDPFEQAVVACTSAPFCKFGIFNVKQKGVDLIQYLRATVSPAATARLDALRLHVSGCKASCAQVHVGHLGLRATLGKDEAGYHEAFDVAVGGEPGRGRLARWVAAEVPAARTFQGIATVLEAYAAEAAPDEPLSAYLSRLPEARLAGFFGGSSLDAGTRGRGDAEMVSASPRPRVPASP
ncbi:MAG: ferredoxin--nitrite reductase [Chloroflexi bacterium]|nr:ferredoxin--nitrite reductase [Chloroflexota bacterium]